MMLDKSSLTALVCFSAFVNQSAEASLATCLFCSAVNNLNSVSQGYTLVVASIKTREFSYK